ncbi:MAG: MoaD/ThiS family protein [Thermoplasmata archaeon]|nr:MoaD/ThiS family protein [Thermoplasmata archaeon]
MTEGEGPIEVILPRALLEYSQGRDTVQLSGRTLAEILGGLDDECPGLRERIVDDQGQVRRFVHVFVNGDSVHPLGAEAVELRPGDQVHILPSVAGG